MAEKNLPEANHVKSVVEHRGEIRDDTIFRKFSRVFFADDPAETAKKIGKTVIEPAIKRSLLDTVSMFVCGRPIFGDTINSTLGSVANSILYGTSYTAYDQASKGSASQPPSNAVVSSIGNGLVKRFNGTAWFHTYEDARNTLDRLHDDLRNYGKAKLADLYEYGEIPGSEYVNQDWGWRELKNVQLYQSGGGWMLSFPPLVQIS